MQISKPYRTKHVYEQHLSAPPGEVFPLLCPVRECEWVDGWAPKLVLSNSGIAEMDCVFVTPDGDHEATWVVTRYEPENYRISFVKITPGVLVIDLNIVLKAAGDRTCRADVAYTYTALGEEGERMVREMTREAYVEFMLAWEKALNAYLEKSIRKP